MGHTRHHAFIVTTWDQAFDAIYEEALRHFERPMVARTVSPLNGYESLLIGPDGGSDGRQASDRFDQARRRFRTWLYLHHPGVAWVEVQYGDEAGLLPSVEHHTSPEPDSRLHAIRRALLQADRERDAEGQVSQQTKDLLLDTMAQALMTQRDYER